MKITVTVVGKKTSVLEYEDHVMLSKAIADAGEDADLSCGGRGICGKCRVWVSGEVSPLSETEKRKLTESEIKEGIRLACAAEATGNAEIRLRELSGMKISDGEFIAYEGIAVDIGTTTVAAKYFINGKCASQLRVLNPQRKHGADVISRISYAESGSGAEEMRRLITDVTDRFVRDAGMDGENIPRVIVGNTVMLHFFEGIDASSIGRAPFLPKSYFGYAKGNDYIPRCISGYVGADAVAAVLASGMTENGKKNTLLCDIGTNGEILYWDGEKLYACSAAAGPALEGAGMECGMMACDGAIDRAEIINGEIKCHVIGEGDPCGICGGGLIDLVSCLYELGVIDESGYMAENFVIGNGIYLSPGDVRAFQLAKSAIRSGIEVMTNGGERKIEEVYISGGFGSGINVDSAVKTGLFPKSFCGKVNFMGNGALNGAIMMLSSEEIRKKAFELAEKAEYTELSLSAEFFDDYIEYMNFPEIT